MEESLYYRQARLLLRVLPLIERYPIFALKGGTAINFFLRDLPRLSVDIDLTYTPIDERATALAIIDSALEGLKAEIEHLVAGSVVMAKKLHGSTTALMVQADGVMVKIEPNLVLRGTLFPTSSFPLRKKAEDLFGMTAKARMLAPAEIYGGKICAALDRQHPRDLFDVKLLFENEGMTEAIRKSFIVHLVSHDRPMVEMLNPNPVHLETALAADFEGMTFIKVSREGLEEARLKLVNAIRQGLTDRERHFILSVKRGAPDWDLIELEGIDRLPAIQWKLINIGRMDKTKHRQAVQKLEKCLGG
jgi:predicted nucleotidyltransferase component of viral defense system